MAEDIERLKKAVLSQPERIPQHVAIIMDGNGRWAALRNKPRTFGHEAGVKAVKKVVRAASEANRIARFTPKQKPAFFTTMIFMTPSGRHAANPESPP